MVSGISLSDGVPDGFRTRNLLSHSQVLDSPQESLGAFYVIVMRCAFYKSFPLSITVYAFGSSLAVWILNG